MEGYEEQLKRIKSIKMTLDTLGSFDAESFLKDSGITHDTFAYKREVQIASSLAEKIPLSDLKRAYVSSSFLQARLKKLLDDLEFFELKPRNRIYLRNQKYPYGTVVDVRYSVEDESITTISFPDELDLGEQVSKLAFSKLVDEGEETDVAGAIVDMNSFIESELNGNIARQDVLRKLFEEGVE